MGAPLRSGVSLLPIGWACPELVLVEDLTGSSRVTLSAPLSLEDGYRRAGALGAPSCHLAFQKQAEGLRCWPEGVSAAFRAWPCCF